MNLSVKERDIGIKVFLQLTKPILEGIKKMSVKRIMDRHDLLRGRRCVVQWFHQVVSSRMRLEPTTRCPCGDRENFLRRSIGNERGRCNSVMGLIRQADKKPMGG